MNPQTYTVTNGADVNHFKSSLDDSTEIPIEIKDFSGPVIGYVGTVFEWLDFEMIPYTDQPRPENSTGPIPYRAYLHKPREATELPQVPGPKHLERYQCLFLNFPGPVPDILFPVPGQIFHLHKAVVQDETTDQDILPCGLYLMIQLLIP